MLRIFECFNQEKRNAERISELMRERYEILDMQDVLSRLSGAYSDIGEAVKKPSDLNKHPTGKYQDRSFLELLKGSFEVDFDGVDVQLVGNTVLWLNNGPKGEGDQSWRVLP